MFGENVEFDYEWISVYTFNCRQVDKMAAGRVIFAGDAAHLVSPFGARGANTGFQDADNLAWKLDLIIKGAAGEELIRSYDEERAFAASVNIMHSTRSTDFITPKSDVSRVFRDAALELSSEHGFARGFINSGRLSTPVPYLNSSLNTPDEDQWSGGVRPGANCIDAPIKTSEGEAGWLLNQLGWRFKLVVFSDDGKIASDLRRDIAAISEESAAIDVLVVSQQAALDGGCVLDTNGLAAERYDAAAGAFYLVRPDQYVTARWRAYDRDKVRSALKRAIAN
jgi:3-(3-hydroxy-phenyl)propionate hydroxylase